MKQIRKLEPERSELPLPIELPEATRVVTREDPGDYDDIDPWLEFGDPGDWHDA